MFLTAAIVRPPAEHAGQLQADAIGVTTLILLVVTWVVFYTAFLFRKKPSKAQEAKRAPASAWGIVLQGFEGGGRACLRPEFAPGLVLVCLALASCMPWEGGCRVARTVEPSDQELISTFRAHHRELERLQEMAAEDARRGWYLGASKPSTLDQSRWSEYNNLRAQIRPGLEMAMNGTTGVIRFIFAHKGVAIGPGWVKGIEYVPGDYGREGVLLPDLNRAANLSANVYIREIEPKWLIFYQRDE